MTDLELFIIVVFTIILGFTFYFSYVTFDGWIDDLKDEMKSRFDDLEKTVKGMNRSE